MYWRAMILLFTRLLKWTQNMQTIVQARHRVAIFKFKHRFGEDTVYPKKYAHVFCFAVLCCGYTLTDFPISIRLNSLALWQSNDCPSASKATLMNMDKYFMWIHYERLHNHNKAKHNKTVCIFLGIYCTPDTPFQTQIHQGPVLLTFLRHVARILANGIAAFKESCAPIG